MPPQNDQLKSLHVQRQYSEQWSALSGIIVRKTKWLYAVYAFTGFAGSRAYKLKSLQVQEFTRSHVPRTAPHVVA